jgi:hypothetical protein
MPSYISMRSFKPLALMSATSLQVVQAIAFRPERGSAIEGYLPVGHQQALGDVEAIIGAGIGGEGAPGGYFSRSRVHRVDFAREMPDFLPFTVILVNGSFFVEPPSGGQDSQQSGHRV